MSALFRNRFKPNSNSDNDDDNNTNARNASTTGSTIGPTVSDGDLKYVGQLGGNNAPVGYQEASGAPVETRSPLGYAVGPVTIVFLNLSKMVGTGIFSIQSGVLKGTGSVGLSLIMWTLGFFTSASSLAVYLEYAAYFPSRSGSEVAYLEQAYPRPKLLLPTTFAALSVILSFSSVNCIVMANYLFKIRDYTASDWETKGLAVLCYTVATLLVLFHTRFSYIFSNVIGAIKLTTLIFVAISGLVVLGGHTSVKNPSENFRNAFEGEASPYGVTNAMYRIIQAYAGYENAFNVVNEIKDPIRNIRNSGFGAVLLVTALYLSANIAFFAAIPKEDIITAKTTAAGLFFTRVFGDTGAVRGLNFLIALSALGNLLAVALGQSRAIRECGRQGVLPYPRFWASTWPFGTPTGPYMLKWVMTVLMILAPPAGDAFNFVSDLQIYPASVFNLLMAVGIYLLRYRRARLGLPRPSFRTWDVVLVFNILVQLYLLVMPFYPPPGGATGGDVSFWYGTYIMVGIGFFALCGLYYFIIVVWWPRYKGYTVRQELLELNDGATTHVLVKVPDSQVDEWDASHDVNGARIIPSGPSDSDDEKGTITNTIKGNEV